MRSDGLGVWTSYFSFCGRSSAPFLSFIVIAQDPAVDPGEHGALRVHASAAVKSPAALALRQRRQHLRRVEDRVVAGAAAQVTADRVEVELVLPVGPVTLRGHAAHRAGRAVAALPAHLHLVLHPVQLGHGAQSLEVTTPWPSRAAAGTKHVLTIVHSVGLPTPGGGPRAPRRPRTNPACSPPWRQ